jgi:hypothetical protein
LCSDATGPAAEDRAAAASRCVCCFIDRPAKYELVINLKPAKALGIDIPDQHLANGLNLRTLLGVLRTRMNRRLGPKQALVTDTVEKVSEKKMWNCNLKQSNPGGWIFES